MPFRIRTSVTPIRDHFDEVHRSFPGAHDAAALQATAHLTRRAQEAMEAAGLPPGTLEHHDDPLAPYVGLAGGSMADRVADHEYGTHEHAPNPVIRTAIRAATPEAEEIYYDRLRQGLGL